MIDAQVFDAYIAELEALRTHGGELAKAFPDLAGRLDIGSRRSRDPQVERVIESAALLAARLRLLIASGAAELPMSILTILAPTLIEPVPSMAILELRGGRDEQVVPRGSRFDYHLRDQALACFSTTMNITAMPFSVRVRRLEAAGGSPDGLALRIDGDPPEQLLLCIGSDELSAATLMDGLVESLTAIEVVGPDGGDPMVIPRNRLQTHGFAPNEAALPLRSAVHQAHRIVTEFMVFPEKFNFVSLNDLPLRSGSEVRFRFSRPLALPPVLSPDLITVNRVPAVNIWRSAATPFDIGGQRLEYPVRVDALRYRTVECHSVENVELHQPGGGQPVRLDPVVAFGQVQGTAIRWGVRRTVSRMGGEVLLYFQGLDYQQIGLNRFLAAPSVLASNRDVAQRVSIGSRLQPVEGLGEWRCRLSSSPTAFRPALTRAESMEHLIGYLQSSISSMAADGRSRVLRDYLSYFPGADEATWIDAIGRVGFHQVASVRRGMPVPSLVATVVFDGARSRTTSKVIVRRVLSALFESQRGINRVEQVHVRTD